ncbi:MAG: alpha/beta hydrolase [Sphingomonadaceae bacterium]|nr:alpha/beta hydrolase [Sphingomonadaceae bacterium]NCA02251.1 alpha/beta hydrolase [Sphingomonadaceae bacterium]
MATPHRLRLATGVDLDVWTAGDPANPPVLFLHGFPESHRTWRHQMAGLADHYYCIAPDQRGYARSDKPADIAAYRVPILVADVLAVADALGIAQFTLVGHDWGGAVAWATALKHPDRVMRLIQCNAAHPYVFQRTLVFDPAQRAASQYITEFRNRDIEGEVAEKGVAWFFEDRFAKISGGAISATDRAAYIDEWSQPGALRGMLNWYRASPLHVPAMDAPAISTPFLDAPFPQLAMPVLVIWGLKDEALLPCQLDGLDTHILNLTIVRVPDAGHFIPWEQPEAVTKAMRDWLA